MLFRSVVPWVSISDSLQSGGFSKALPLPSVGQLASLAEKRGEGKERTMRVREGLRASFRTSMGKRRFTRAGWKWLLEYRLLSLSTASVMEWVEAGHITNQIFGVSIDTNVQRLSFSDIIHMA